MMKETADFIFRGINSPVEKAEYTWQSPSNIALVKYWGKKGDQLPANASLSFTLSQCVTTTTVKFEKRDTDRQNLQLFLDGKEQKAFGQKAFSFLDKIRGFQPFLQDYHIQIHTKNSFPHSSGIASSASGMSALALCCMSLEKELNGNVNSDFFYEKASFLARIGSGSASRSVYPKFAMWGQHHEYANGSDLYAIQVPEKEVHKDFHTFRDTILLIDQGKKSVSSTAGHSLLDKHPFRDERFRTANNNITELKHILEKGDIEAFGNLVEQEALMLHALMMSGPESFILMKPNTLAVIEKVRNWRTETGTPLFFTLDAGANVHLLYPESAEPKVLEFIQNELIVYCEDKNYICDNVGEGPQQLKP
ncbi:MAG: diphosphomevalonate decarboxylase [Salibacter sp.]|uniref:diphosphomevalonate decarboxylase n=1 Tax=Salibacter sp. TaxID=2010995 RepID=UPI0028706102|nr:diphosphomevalonate decarboxylase [Salibacter sp.]MDR9398784.1 diphosphomevalonate decarboxylase [Salibacter sp.]